VTRLGALRFRRRERLFLPLGVVLASLAATLLVAPAAANRCPSLKGGPLRDVPRCLLAV
jgi:hypothetical protein